MRIYVLMGWTDVVLATPGLMWSTCNALVVI